MPIADISYMRPPASGMVPRVPSNLIRSLDFLSHPARITDDGAAESFRSNDRIAARVKIGAPARHELRVEFYRDDSQQPSVVRTLRTEHDQETVQARLDLNEVPDPIGGWRVRVMFEDLLLAEGRFEVRAAN